MAKTLSKTGITTAGVIQASHVTQSIDALTGAEAYDVIISGSLGVGTTTTVASSGRATTLQNRGGFISSQGFDSRHLFIATIPSAAGWYRIAKWSNQQRGGGILTLSTTGGSFTPATWVIKYFKSWANPSARHTLKLEQYGNTIFITHARIMYDEDEDCSFLEIYSPLIEISGTPKDVEVHVYHDKMLGFNGIVTALDGTLDETDMSNEDSAVLLEMPFIFDGTTVEQLHITGSAVTVSQDGTTINATNTGRFLMGSDVFFNSPSYGALEIGTDSTSLNNSTGNTRIFVTSSGGSLPKYTKVGIGTSTPKSGLAIQSSASNSVIVSTIGNGQTDPDQHLHRWSEDSFGDALTQYRDSNNIEQIRFRGKSDGINWINGKLNIGVASTSIGSNLHLHVAGGISGSTLQVQDLNVTGGTTNDNGLVVGGSNQSTYLKIKSEDPGGSGPASTTLIRMFGYGPRGQGIKYYNADHSNKEWFHGLRYQGGGFNTFQIGYDSSGAGHGEYISSSLFLVKDDGQVGIGPGLYTPGLLNGTQFIGVAFHVSGSSLGRSITEGDRAGEFIMNHRNWLPDERLKFVQSRSGSLYLGNYEDDGQAHYNMELSGSGDITDQTAIIYGDLVVSGSITTDLGGNNGISGNPVGLVKTIGTTSAATDIVYASVNTKYDTSSSTNNFRRGNVRNGSVHQISINSAGANGTHDVNIVLPRPSSSKSDKGFNFKIIIKIDSVTGTTTRNFFIRCATVVNGGAKLEPQTTNNFPAIVGGRIVGTIENNQKTEAYFSTTLNEAIQLNGADKVGNGDQFDFYCDGDVWYVSGFTNASDVTFVA